MFESWEYCKSFKDEPAYKATQVQKKKNTSKLKASTNDLDQIPNVKIYSDKIFGHLNQVKKQ